jgi:hypothetical protein
MRFDQLRTRIHQALEARPPSEAYQEAYDMLSTAAQAIEEVGIVNGGMITVEPGHLVNLGQQYNVVLSIPGKSFRDVLFRAYMPTNGFPVTLDLFGEDPVTCDTSDALEVELVRFAQEHVSSRLAMLR